MTISPARRVHPQTTTVQLESQAFEVVAEGGLIRQEIRTGKRFNAKAEAHYQALLAEVAELEHDLPATLYRTRLIRHHAHEWMANEVVEDHHTMTVNDQRACTVMDYGKAQIEILEPMLGARPTRRALGAGGGVDGWDGGAA